MKHNNKQNDLNEIMDEIREINQYPMDPGDWKGYLDDDNDLSYLDTNELY